MMNNDYGLIGYPLSHSFSKQYFTKKFDREGISDSSYENYPIEQIGMLPALLENNLSIRGLNVTIPYKETVIGFLDDLAEDAAEIQAVNTIKRYSDGKSRGFNTDIYGFSETLDRFIPPAFNSGVLILGTGGASKAVRYVCRQRKLDFQNVSRRESDDAISYALLNSEWMQRCHLIVNTTPLGMHPETQRYPDIPYSLLTPEHYLLDLIYNPATTRFLEEGNDRGCRTKNGLEMLILQAEKSWEIWNNPHC